MTAKRYFLSPTGAGCLPEEIAGVVDEVHLYQNATLCSAAAPPDLRLTAALLVDIVATVYSEAWDVVPEEAVGITWVIRNRASFLFGSLQDAVSSPQFWARVRAGAFKGRGKPKYLNTHGLNIEVWLSAAEKLKQSSQQGVYPELMTNMLYRTIRGLTMESDVTHGAYFFDARHDPGTGLGGLNAGTHPWRQPQATSNLFPSGWKGAIVGGNDPACATPPKPLFCDTLVDGKSGYEPWYVLTASIGATYFFRKNPVGQIFDKSGRALGPRKEYP